MKDNAIQEFVDAIKEPHVETDKTYSATVSHIDEEGRVWVYLAGSTIETPTESTSSEVKRGDVVTVEWRNNKLYIAGNYSNPSAGLTRIIYVEQKTNEAIEEAKQAVQNVGIAIEKSIEAMKIAGDTDQHYWFTETGTDTGAHITEVTQEEWNDLTSENYHSGGNLLARSNGIAVRDGLAELATFGANGAQIGQDGESHISQDYHSLQMVDKEGDTYFHVSDLRDNNGECSAKDTFIGDGATIAFALSISVSSNLVVKVNDVEQTINVDYTYNSSLWKITFTSPPINGAIIDVTYISRSRNAKAYTLGSRAAGSIIGGMSFAEGRLTTASGYASHAEGILTISSGIYSHAEGRETTASGTRAHAEGQSTIASGDVSHAEGQSTTASGYASHAEGQSTTASGWDSHAEGYGTTASGDYSHAEGYGTTASGYYSHAEGNQTTASSNYSHVEGQSTTASGYASHAQNLHTLASSQAQTALGKYNIEDTNNTYVVIIGNGTSDDARSNAFTVDWAGNVLTSGGVNARGVVATGTNLNSVTTVGTYYLNGNNTYKNAPTSFGILEVIAYDTTASILMQRVTQDSLQWTRRRTASNTWTTWQLTNTYGIISEDVLLADNVTVNASSYANSSLSVAKTGYTPIGVVGYHLQNASSNGANNTLCAMHSCYLSGSSCAWIVRNTGGSNAKIKITATILYTIS